MKKLLFVLLTLCCGVLSYGQDARIGNVDHLREFVKKEIKFPLVAAQNKQEGTLVGGIVFTDEKPKFILLNPLDKGLNKEFKRTMGKMIKRFKIDGIDTLLFHVEFKHVDHNFKVDLTHKPKQILAPVAIKTYGMVSGPAFRRTWPKETDYEKGSLEKVKRCIKKEKFKKAIVILDQMIRRNPYQPEFYHYRSICYSALGKGVEGGKRFNKMIRFLKYPDFEKDLIK